MKTRRFKISNKKGKNARILSIGIQVEDMIEVIPISIEPVNVELPAVTGKIDSMTSDETEAEMNENEEFQGFLKQLQALPMVASHVTYKKKVTKVITLVHTMTNGLHKDKFSERFEKNALQGRLEATENKYRRSVEMPVDMLNQSSLNGLIAGYVYMIRKDVIAEFIKTPLPLKDQVVTPWTLDD